MLVLRRDFFFFDLHLKHLLQTIAMMIRRKAPMRILTMIKAEKLGFSGSIFISVMLNL